MKTLVLHCNNQRVLDIATNHVFHKRTKHLEIDYHIVREKMLNGLMKLLPCSSKVRLEDFFTQPLLP